ncbi:MAG: cytochrome c3 family protein, partial [Candidatus Zixiibacteriota bacterium]
MSFMTQTPSKNTILAGLFTTVLTLFLLFSPSAVKSQTVDDCMMCHEDRELTAEIDGKKTSAYIDLERYRKSVHADLECIDCHQDLNGFEDFPHEDDLARVDCSLCHDDIADTYRVSLHGQAVEKGEKLAPQCRDCHGNHYIDPVSSPQSNVTKFNIPFLCGRCHKEGTPVSQTYDIPQDSILSHYSQSIHGVGLFKQGLTVTAVCTDCHTSHSVLPHTDPKSSIHRDNVAKTCQKCHGRIEEVHRKVIRGELWEKNPGMVPVCVDCHAPHEIRRVLYEEGMSDRECLRCHGNKKLTAVIDDKTVSMYVDTLETHGSMHRHISCAQCHTGATPSHERPCATVINKVDCSICHTEVVEKFVTSTHGKLADRGDLRAPGCNDCHGTHNIKGFRDPNSPTYPTQVPDLCGRCHGTEGKASVDMDQDRPDPITSYLNGIHGIGLKQSGLVVTAKCTDCHTPHHVLPKDDPESSVNHENLARTCSECHRGIYDEFNRSIHSPAVTQTDKPLPTCEDCHESHAIVRTDSRGFRDKIIDQCGACHEEVTETYFETFHGKVSKLGYEAAAKCYDCHGSHNILPPENQHSTLSRQNIVSTCGKCHPGSHRQFAGYL